MAEACCKHDLKLGLYYSQEIDWHEPHGGGVGRGHTHIGNDGRFDVSWTNDWDFPDRAKKDYRICYEKKIKPQVEELLTRYGDLCLIWFDTPLDIPPECSQELYETVKKYQPHCLVNSRIGCGMGDYESCGDNRLPERDTGELVEAPITLNRTWGYKAFDNDETTVASGIQCAIDYGRDVRIDRVRIVTSGDKSVTVPIQFSRDGFTWHTVAKRGRLDFPAANIDRAQPIVARYVRYGGDGTTEKTPQINEVRTYALAGEAFVAVTNESARHTKAGLVISGTVSTTGLVEGAQVDLYGYAGPQDYGLNKADWDAAGIVPTYIGQYSAGASFTSPALRGTANATSGVRYGAVVAVASGAASSIGTVFPFTLNDETIIDITQEMVVTNYAANFNYSSALTQLWKQGFWGARNFINQYDNRSNGAATLGKKLYRITMIEWHDRPEWGCYGRARTAKFRIYADPDVISSANYHDMAAASSNWGGNSASIHANRWNAVAPAAKEEGHGVGIYGANAGNGFFRFWGFEVPRGLSIHVY